MKIAAISDIHGNIYALMKALEDIDEQKVDKIICLNKKKRNSLYKR